MIIGTRASELALWQAQFVTHLLTKAGLHTEIVAISTTGDRIPDRPLNELGTQGVFTKELEDALLAGRIDAAVHSLKDTSLNRQPGLLIAAVSERIDPSDLLIIRKDMANRTSDFGIDSSHLVGTSAVRREKQIKALVPGICIKNLRGNVHTRLEKLGNGEYDAIFLASAGIKRLGIELDEFYVQRLDPKRFIPSPGQGALAIEMRDNDPFLSIVHDSINHKQSADAVTIERSLLELLGGGCSLPLGAYAEFDSDIWFLNAFWGGNDDRAVWIRECDIEPDTLVRKVYEKVTIMEDPAND